MTSVIVGTCVASVVLGVLELVWPLVKQSFFQSPGQELDDVGSGILGIAGEL